MNEINPKPEYWVLSLSGGKDSTALGLEWLKRHQQDPVTYPLHEVIYHLRLFPHFTPCMRLSPHTAFHRLVDFVV